MHWGWIRENVAQENAAFEHISCSATSQRTLILQFFNKSNLNLCLTAFRMIILRSFWPFSEQFLLGLPQIVAMSKKLLLILPHHVSPTELPSHLETSLRLYVFLYNLILSRFLLLIWIKSREKILRKLSLLHEMNKVTLLKKETCRNIPIIYRVFFYNLWSYWIFRLFLSVLQVWWILMMN